jgi:predicted ArsR family transcriptional regulator
MDSRMRHETTLALLQEKGELSVVELSERTGASLMTIRRDLQILEEEGGASTGPRWRDQRGVKRLPAPLFRPGKARDRSKEENWRSCCRDDRRTGDGHPGRGNDDT